MLNIKFILSKFNRLFGLLIIVNLLQLSLVNPATAEQKSEKSKSANSNYGLPTNRRDGGSRSGDNCLANVSNSNLIALIPNETVGIKNSASPTLFFYVPEVSQQKTIEFVLRNEQDELIYEAFLTTPGKGIMSVKIPAVINSNQPETEQNYHWYLSMICNPQERSRDVVVEGWLHQKEIDRAIKQKLQFATSVEKAELYSEQGFWYDAIATLAHEQDFNAKQSTVRKKWSELLGTVGLEDLASEPFIKSKMIKTSANSR
ncbi:DUF928 domain-containing protein [Pleurocapsa sp. FMAR1]|uniref:DUF928 domain-containing protein n=1 Tax=Pleurocapsa sp. FMAR1 TaxID=3040204 RepID=UPI0029C919A2|nr:DUF928 domain-containing protein [Pleurocapsa sp. FMAR1]